MNTKHNAHRSKPRMKRTSAAFAAGLLLTVAVSVHAQQDTKPDSAVTVITLYSEWRPVPGKIASMDKPASQPIKIVNGGVRNAGDTCWKLSDTGQITTVAGDCVVLRSADPGEQLPASN